MISISQTRGSRGAAAAWMRFGRALSRLTAAALLCASATGCALKAFNSPQLHAASIGEVPRPNRVIETNTVWAAARPLAVTLKPAGNPAGGGWPVTLKAVHDGRAISILAVWPDATESGERSSWVFDPRGKQYFRLDQQTDFFAIRFGMAGTKDSCMMSGAEGTYDVWEWRGGWSHVTGYADDEVMTIARQAPPGPASVYPIGRDGDHMFIQIRSDKGELPYENAPRPDKHRNTGVQLGIIARTSTKDATKIPREALFTGQDVLVESVYQNGGYSAEFFRLLNTGSDDDYPLDGRGPHWFSLAVSDGREGQDHFTSGPIALFLD